MKMFARLGVVVILTLAPLAPSSNAAGAGPVESIDALQKASLGMFVWFQELLASAEQLVDQENRRRLIEDLTNLSKSIYDLEQDKRYLLDELKRTPVNPAGIERAVKDSDSSLRELRQQLRQLGLQIRQQFRHGGVEVEKALADAAGTRKLWLEEVVKAVERGNFSDFGPLLNKGRETVEALAAANLELIKLIDRLNSMEA